MTDFGSDDRLVPHDGPQQTSTMTAFFDNRRDAEAAVERLQLAELGAVSIQLVLGRGEGSADVEPAGIWSALENYLFPQEDREIYAEGLSRGGYLVTVSGIDDRSYEAIRDILDDEGTIDLDERADLWRSEGWSGWQRDVPSTPATGYTEDTFDAPRPATAKRDHARSSGTIRTYRTESASTSTVSDHDSPAAAMHEPGPRSADAGSWSQPERDTPGSPRQDQDGQSQSQQLGSGWSQSQKSGS
ncbi:hypothetical protein [Sinorhizobium sp. CCBAU 05631]|uniref:hypothetical protein n=1 Tax=Sinorhizobium sp. CCBAU 05631 TaxID=794846 RepID=UPI0004BAB651|nr:hypothetical protein [Sinorhizobium sp. CCBAU 05631]ASY59148.1 hypothetical protein SS05631_b50560 [Sinorhizobium sp. CCBAU 05631]